MEWVEEKKVKKRKEGEKKKSDATFFRILFLLGTGVIPLYA